MNDHRQMGRELGLFDSDPLIGAGLPYWLPAGAAIRHAIEEFVREVERRAGYQHVYSPVLGKRELYEISGHWAHYRDDMFPPMSAGGEQMVLRPSLCPHHAVIYRSRQRSYRELPLRIAELGGQFREEASGALGGLTRVRAMQLVACHRNPGGQAEHGQGFHPASDRMIRHRVGGGIRRVGVQDAWTNGRSRRPVRTACRGAAGDRQEPRRAQCGGRPGPRSTFRSTPKAPRRVPGGYELLPQPAARARREHPAPGARSSPRAPKTRPRGRRPREIPSRGRTPPRDPRAARTPGRPPGPARRGRNDGFAQSGRPQQNPAAQNLHTAILSALARA